MMQNSKLNMSYTPNPNDSRIGNTEKGNYTKQELSAEDHFVSEYNNKEDKQTQEDVIIRFFKIMNNGYDKSRIIYQIAICPFRQNKYALFQMAVALVLRDQQHHNDVRRAFTVSYFKDLIENCEQLEVIGLALKLQNTLIQPTLQGQSLNQREQQQFKDQIVEFLDSKIDNLVTVNELDTFFLTDILQQLVESKTTQSSIFVKFRQQEMKELAAKIYTIIDEILYFNLDKLQSIPNYLLRILLKWIMILPSMSDIEIKYIQKVINLITTRALSSDREQNYDIYKLSELFLFIFKTMKIQWDSRDPIRPNQNLNVLIEAVKKLKIDKQIKNTQFNLILFKLVDVPHEFFDKYSFEIVYNFFNPKETVVILNNLIDCGYTLYTCKLIYFIIRSLLPFRRYDVIKEIHTEFIMKRIVTKIQCKNCIQSTLGLIKETLFGLAKVVYLTDIQAQILVKQFRFIIQFKQIISNKDVQCLYEFFYLILKNQDITKGLNSQSLQSIKEIVNIGQENKYFDQNEYYLRQRVDRMLGQDVYLTQEINQIQPTQQLSGLINMGNTCYINSFVHSLYHAQAFRDFILYQSKVFSSFVDPIEEIMKIFLKMYSLPQGQDIDPKQLKKSLPEPFRSSMEQQDSGEFGRIYLDYIQNYLKDTESKDEIDKFFFGKIENITQCQNCKNQCKKIEKMLDIYVNFCDEAYNKEQKTYDLVSMIRHSFQAETFDENNAYFCDKCNKKTSAIKNTLVKVLPPYLTIAIGRFQYDKQRQERVKLLYPMNLPMSFNIQDLFENSSIPQNLLSNFEYQLYAFIVHLGSQIDAGHYITYGRNLDEPNGKWKLYDDNFVTEQLYTNANDLAQNFAESETPYILFYANKKHSPIELHKYIRSKSQIYQNMGNLSENFNMQEFQQKGGYFYNQNNSDTNQSQNGNRFQNTYSK